jgi:hypothetical protein
MSKWRLNRFWFWIQVPLYFVLSEYGRANQFARANSGDPNSSGVVLSMLMFIALALAVSARLNDAGRNRWIAIGAAVFIGVHAVFPKPAGASASNLSAMYFVPLVLFLALLIWAGTRSEAPHLSTSPSVGTRTM